MFLVQDSCRMFDSVNGYFVGFNCVLAGEVSGSEYLGWL
jgi:hypothetical protein